MSLSLAFETMLHHLYTGDKKKITSIQDLDLLFGIYYLADKVSTGTFIRHDKRRLYVSSMWIINILNIVSCFLYFLSKLKRLVRSTIEKLPLSSENYAAVLREKICVAPEIHPLTTNAIFLSNLSETFFGDSANLNGFFSLQWLLQYS